MLHQRFTVCHSSSAGKPKWRDLARNFQMVLFEQNGNLGELVQIHDEM